MSSAAAAEASAGDIERPVPDLGSDPFLTNGAGGDAAGLGAAGSTGPGAGGAAEGDGDGGAPQGTAAYSGGSGSCFLALVMVWQAVVLSHHSASFPGSIFTGEHNSGMTPSCEMLFWVTNWSLFLSIFMIAMDGVLLVVGRSRGIEGSVVQAVKFGEGVANTLKFIIAVIGIWVVAFKVKSEETLGCAELYSCAWWCFVGFLLIPCLICGLFIAGVRAGHAAARDSLPMAEDTLLNQGPSYGTVAQPAQPPSGVEPFAGQGHRLA